jgi:predicted acyl esterase
MVVSRFMNTSENMSEPSLRLALSPQRAPVEYDRAPGDHVMVAEKDVLVAMRDGVRIAVDVYRPAVAQPVPALLAFSVHNKDLQGPDAAAHRALDAARSLPGRPWHPLTRAAQRPVAPGEINEYAIEIMATANQFRRGHRICVEITSLDLATGVGGATNVEYIPYHICSSRTVLHTSSTIPRTLPICCCRSFPRRDLHRPSG